MVEMTTVQSTAALTEQVRELLVAGEWGAVEPYGHGFWSRVQPYRKQLEKLAPEMAAALDSLSAAHAQKQKEWDELRRVVQAHVDRGHDQSGELAASLSRGKDS